MNRTREIAVWVEPIFVNTALSKGLVTREPSGSMIQAKLIIELPERKVTISESEFVEAMEQIVRAGIIEYGSFYYDNIKSRLFKDAKE